MALIYLYSLFTDLIAYYNKNNNQILQFLGWIKNQ